MYSLLKRHNFNGSCRWTWRLWLTSHYQNCILVTSVHLLALTMAHRCIQASPTLVKSTAVYFFIMVYPAASIWPMFCKLWVLDLSSKYGACLFRKLHIFRDNYNLVMLVWQSVRLLKPHVELTNFVLGRSHVCSICFSGGWGNSAWYDYTIIQVHVCMYLIVPYYLLTH